MSVGQTKVIKKWALLYSTDVSSWIYLVVSKNRDTPKSSILIGFSIINHPFSGTPIFGNTHLEKFQLRKFWHHVGNQEPPIWKRWWQQRQQGLPTFWFAFLYGNLPGKYTGTMLFFFSIWTPCIENIPPHTIHGTAPLSDGQGMSTTSCYIHTAWNSHSLHLAKSPRKNLPSFPLTTVTTTHDGSMGLVYLPTFTINIYSKSNQPNVGKCTIHNSNNNNNNITW